MQDYYKPLKLNLKTYSGQFILTQHGNAVPEGWKEYTKEGWSLGVNNLPVMGIENRLGQKIGWCIGYPLNHQDPSATKLIIGNKHQHLIDEHSIEDVYQFLGGRYVLIILGPNEKKIFLDPAGSMGVVFSIQEPAVASTPTLMNGSYPWDDEIIQALNMPTSGLWFPSGLTPKKNVKRLLPNHYLDMDDWQTYRHWPTSFTDLTIKADPKELVDTIIHHLIKGLEILTKNHPVQLSLTAGRDSRMLLACARGFLDRALFFTFADKKDPLDNHVALKLAKLCGLNHSFIPVIEASEQEKVNWLYLIGHSASGAIWRIHKALEGYDPGRVMLPGMGGEVGRSFYWRNGDHENKSISPHDLLNRSALPSHERIVGNTEQWLSELSDLNAFMILDLFYLEQRLGCWAAPLHYCNVFSKFELSLFNHRKIYSSMVRLPYEYRIQKQLSEDICRELWPELLQLPFNEYPGLKKYIHHVNNYLIHHYKNSTARAKRLVNKLMG